MHSQPVLIRGNLPLVFMKEKKTFIAYTPALDLATHGKTQKEAKKNFDEALCLYLEELVAHGTLDAALEEMGWEKNKKEWQPPVSLTKVTSIPLRVPVAA